MQRYLIAAATAGLALSPPLVRASILIDLSSPQAGQTVAVGDTIHAIVSASTDDPNGIASLQTRLETTLDGATPDVSPFHFSVIATNPGNTTSNQPVVSSFGPGLADASTILAKGTAKFGSNGQPAVSPTGNEPLFGFTGDFGTGSRAAPRFFSAGNGTLSEFFDVSFRADNPGAVQFKFADNVPNSVQGFEYSSPFVNSSSAVDSSPASIVPHGGFSITIGMGGLPGDANADGSVGFDDLLILAQHYGLSKGATVQDGDFNTDGSVGFDDLLILAQHYGDHSAAPAVVPAPEPGATGALCAGAIGLLRRRRR